MPQRLAETDPAKAVPEIIGSGPCRYLAAERLQGALNAYARFGGYVPRPSGTPSLLAGPKIAHFDRVEWHTIPDAATAVAAWLGATVFRALDVRATRRVVDMVASIRGDRPAAVNVRGVPA